MINIKILKCNSMLLFNILSIGTNNILFRNGFHRIHISMAFNTVGALELLAGLYDFIIQSVFFFSDVNYQGGGDN